MSASASHPQMGTGYIETSSTVEVRRMAQELAGQASSQLETQSRYAAEVVAVSRFTIRRPDFSMADTFSLKLGPHDDGYSTTHTVFVHLHSPKYLYLGIKGIMLWSTHI
jgi:hypothetical protein